MLFLVNCAFYFRAQTKQEEETAPKKAGWVILSLGSEMSDVDSAGLVEGFVNRLLDLEGSG